MAKKRTTDKMTSAELDKIHEYNRLVFNEIVKPVKQAAEKIFNKCGLGKPSVIVFVSKNKAKTKIDKICIEMVAKGLRAERITDPKKIAEMKKKKYPWRPE